MLTSSSSLVSTLAMRWHFRRETNWSTMVYSWVDFSPCPEMIRGVRASSIRMESTSSTTAKLWPRCTSSLE